MKATAPQNLAALAQQSKEIARAIPNAKGGEQPRLQTYRTEIYSYFTKPTTDAVLLYSAENWVRVKLELKTAGPVAVGTAQQIAPVLSGKGILLGTNESYEANLARGTRLFIISSSINRVSVTIEPVPWLEQIDEDIRRASGATREIVTSAMSFLGGLYAKLTSSSSAGRMR